MHTAYLNILLDLDHWLHDILKRATGWKPDVVLVGLMQWYRNMRNKTDIGVHRV